MNPAQTFAVHLTVIIKPDESEKVRRFRVLERQINLPFAPTLGLELSLGVDGDGSAIHFHINQLWYDCVEGFFAAIEAEDEVDSIDYWRKAKFTERPQEPEAATRDA